MKSLEIKIAYLDNDLKIIDRNTEFYSYFEKVGFLYENIADIVVPEQQEKFLNFIKTSQGQKEFKVFKFKKISGEILHNLVSIKYAKINNKDCISVRITDPTNVLSFINEAAFYEKKISSALSLTNEYLFLYEQSTNIIKIDNFIQNKKTTVYEQDLDSWCEDVISNSLIAENDIHLFNEKMSELKQCKDSFSLTINCSLRAGHSVFERMCFKAERLENNGSVYMIGRMLPEVMIEQAEKSNEILQELKLDALTGVYNKKAITSYAQKRFVPGTKENAVLAIVDLDHFKPVNDAYGHLAGDKVLEKAGLILKEIVGDSGVIGRYGGDEFLLILEDMDETKFRGIFRTINNDIRASFANMFTDIKVTASIGSALYSKDGSSFDELFKKADFCLYRAKDKGRDRYVFFRDDLHGELYKKASESKTEGIKYDVREVKELKSMADFLVNLGAQSKPAIITVLEHMLKTYNLDAINIYYGEAMARMHAFGQHKESLSEARYIYSEEFTRALDGKSFIKVDFTTELKESAKAFGKILDERGVKSSIQCLLGTQERILGLITFDRLKEGAMWAEYETNCCVMVGAALNLLPESKLRVLFM